MAGYGDVEEYDMDTGVVTFGCVDEAVEAGSVRMDIRTVARPGLVKVYAHVFPGSGRGIMFSNEELLTALLTGVKPTARTDSDGDGGDTPEPAARPGVEVEDNDGDSGDNGDTPEPAATAQERRAGVIDDIVREIAEAVASDTVNEDRVREIAREEAARVENVRPVIRVEIPDREPRELEGTFHPVFQRVLRIVGRGQHVYLTGPAGTGKSTIAEQVAEALDIPFASISCHPQMTATSLFGYCTADGTYIGTEWRRVFEHGGVFCVDEMDNANSSLMSALNQSLANSIAAFPDGMVRRSTEIPTIVVGTGNTFGTGPDALYVGRQAQDGALRTRFYTLEVPVDEKLERAMIDRSGIAAADAAEWHRIVTSARGAVEQLGMRVIVSPRHAMIGAEALAAGESFEQVITATFLAGVPSEQALKIRETAGL